MSPFSLSINYIEGKKVIEFANNSREFVEVVFGIDGKDARHGLTLSPDTKGYGYPPKLEKPVKKLKNGSPLPFRPAGGVVTAQIFGGDGQYRDEDLDMPPFLRHELANKIKFKRTSNQPIEVLQVKY